MRNFIRLGGLLFLFYFTLLAHTMYRTYCNIKPYTHLFQLGAPSEKKVLIKWNFNRKNGSFYRKSLLRLTHIICYFRLKSLLPYAPFYSLSLSPLVIFNIKYDCLIQDLTTIALVTSTIMILLDFSFFTFTPLDFT